VEGVVSGSYVIVTLTPSMHTIRFKIGGVKCPRDDEPFATEAKFTTERYALHRDVQIIFTSFDKDKPEGEEDDEEDQSEEEEEEEEEEKEKHLKKRKEITRKKKKMVKRKKKKKKKKKKKRKKRKMKMKRIEEEKKKEEEKKEMQEEKLLQMLSRLVSIMVSCFWQITVLRNCCCNRVWQKSWNGPLLMPSATSIVLWNIKPRNKSFAFGLIKKK